MNFENKIEYFEKIETQSMKLIKYCLLIISIAIALSILDIYLFSGFFGIAKVLSSFFVLWFIVPLGMIFILVVVSILSKLAIALLATRAKKKKLAVKKLVEAIVAIFLLLIISFCAAILLFSPSAPRSKARDARRLSDMRQLVEAQEKYYTDNDFYYSSDSMPTAIGAYLTTVPTDPSTSLGYGFLSNARNPDKFCYFAVLENKYKNASGCADGCKYYSATQAGNFYLEAPPGNFDECDQKSSYNHSFIE